jgi:peptidoglycan/xylan/chitin deacetylase (PgdA/CDA1 family)
MKLGLVTERAGGKGTYTVEWSTGQTDEEIPINEPLGKQRITSVTVTSGGQGTTTETTVYGPPLMQTDSPPRISYPRRGNGSKIMLTFDDYGPMGEILDILGRYDAKAIFFPYRQWADTVPGLIERAIDEGHLVCNHTYSHVNLTRLSAERVRSEISAGAIGDCNLLRPPSGARNAFVDSVAAELGFYMYMWHIDTRDWARSYPEGDQEILNIVLSQAFPGAVVLMHMHSADTLAALPDMIEHLQAAGYVVSW